MIIKHQNLNKRQVSFASMTKGVVILVFRRLFQRIEEKELCVRLGRSLTLFSTARMKEKKVLQIENILFAFDNVLLNVFRVVNDRFFLLNRCFSSERKSSMSEFHSLLNEIMMIIVLTEKENTENLIEIFSCHSFFNDGSQKSFILVDTTPQALIYV